MRHHSVIGQLWPAILLALLAACGEEGGLPASPAGAGTPTGTTGPTDTPPGTTPVARFFAFTKANPTDPQGMKDFGLDQMTKVADAMRGLTSPVFGVEVATDPSQISVASLRARLAAYRDSLRPEDTFVMYSHTHGGSPGILIDFEGKQKQDPTIAYSWNALAEDIVALPARSVIIFTMACHSGYLAEAVKALAARWQGQRASSGRNLIVLTSVSKDQLSTATNNSTDPAAIGNPFTYAVRTALGGAADGTVDGSEDERITLEELVQYVLRTTKQKSKDQLAEPQLAGEYDRGAVFAAVPAAAR
jgi:hypothetical protein